MSIRLMNLAWEWPDLSPTDKLILLSLADHANDDGECWPSQSRLAERAGVSDRHVRTVLSRLESKGLVERSRRKHTSNLYQLLLDESSSLLNQDRNHSSGQGVQDRNKPGQDRNPSSGKTGTPVPTNHQEPPFIEPRAQSAKTRNIDPEVLEKLRPEFMKKKTG